MDPSRIHATVLHCLEACYQSLQPHVCLKDYAAALRADPGWREDDVRRFERAAKQLLAELLDA